MRDTSGCLGRPIGNHKERPPIAWLVGYLG